MKKIYESIIRWLDENTRVYTEIADKIWEYAETAWQEHRSAALQISHLKDEGFTILENVAGIKTAFSAERGAGKPVFGFIGEYDALPGLSQKAIPTKEPVVEGAPGHGCGHNLLGTGAVAAAVAVSRWLEETGTTGTVRYYGCPAEEQLLGKTFMARDGCFDDLDAALNFHPGAVNMPAKGSAVGLYDVRFSFKGTAAHAGGAPHRGRSALDAVELMNVGVNYLREHIEENVRIHSVIPDGGLAPNIVPDHAELWYYIRGRDRKQVDELTRRVIQCGRGAAMATDTKARVVHHDSITERIPNWPMTNMLNAILHRCGAPKFSQADQSAADKIAPDNKKFSSEILPVVTEQEPASSDDNNVSYFAPLGRFNVACVPVDIVAHHRQFAAMCTTSGAYRGMRKAAEIMAMAAIELTMNKPLLSKAKGEFKNNKKGKKYELPHLKRKPVFKRSI